MICTAVTCSVYGNWQTEDETVVILQSLSHFSDSLDPGQMGCRPAAACRNQVPLTAVAETWHFGQKRNLAESF